LQAVVTTFKSVFEAIVKPVPATLPKTVQESWENFKAGAHKDAKSENAGKWFKDLSIEVLGEEASKVALARNYAFISRDAVNKPVDDPKKLQLGSRPMRADHFDAEDTERES
jgi:hypothetical protein